MKVGWYYHRLRAMTFTEVAQRLTERWKHRSDATFRESLPGIALGEAAQGILTFPEASAAPAELRETLARDAAALMRGDWKLFGWRAVNVGSPPQWHRDPVQGVEVSRSILSHQLNHRALPDGADARTIWECNRWAEMTRLAMHAWLNADGRAASVALDWLEDWCEANPVGYGINWCSPLEAALRVTNFVWFDTLVADHVAQHSGDDASVLLPRLKALRRRIVPAHVGWISRYLSFGSSANNHLLGELTGLLHVVKRWPNLATVTGSADDLWSRISDLVLDQFAEDGGNREQALHYHLFAWEMAWHGARLTGIKQGAAWERLQKAAEFFVRFSMDGEAWDYGDNDDAQVLPVTSERAQASHEWRAWMKGDRPASCTMLGFWLGDPNLRGEGWEEGTWQLAPESGMACVASRGWKLRLDASPLGYGAMAAHGHADALHLSIWDANGQALIIDPGTGGYFSMPAERAALASWQAHNGPLHLSGFDAPKRAGVFLWTHHHAKPKLSLIDGRSIRAELTHEGCTMTRIVSMRDDDTVIVEDKIDTSGEFSVLWTFAPEVEIEQCSPSECRITHDGQSWTASLQLINGHAAVSTTMASRHFGDTITCPSLRVTSHKKLVTMWRRCG